MLFAILAISDNNMIGKENELPWPHNREDMERFRAITEDCIVVMGSKTWNSLGDKAPLKDRLNIVVSRKDFREFSGANMVSDEKPLINLVDKLTSRYPNKDIAVIGGAMVYAQLIPFCDLVYVTRMHGEFDGDVDFSLDSLLDNEFELDDEDPSEDKSCTFQRWSKIIK